MSNYLSNLVDRSLDRADVIQPRLRSLFEPAQGIGSPIAGLWQEAEPMMEIIEQSVPEDRNQRPVTRQQSPISRIFDRVINRRLAEAEVNLDRPSRSTQTNAIEMSQPQFNSLSESTLPTSVDLVEPISISTNTPVIQPRFSQPQLTEQQIDAGSLAGENPAVVSSFPIDRERHIDRTIDNPDRSSVLNPAPISVRDRIDRVQESSLTDTPSQNSPRLGQRMESSTMEQIRSAVRAIEPEVITTSDRSMMPTIQVSIGRIEVRATTVPANPAAKTARSQPPVMSLDEYLNQRGGGK
jgi:hypothetical protein